MNLPQIISENTYQNEDQWFLDLEVHTIKGLTDDVVKYLNKQKVVQAKGFRPGKVPKSLLERQLGKEQLYVEAMIGQYDLVRQDKSFRPVADPELVTMETYPDGSIKFKVKVQLMPPFDVEESHYLNIEVEREALTEEKIEEALSLHLQSLQKQFGTNEPVERPAEKSDEVTVSFKGSIDEKEEPLLTHSSMTIQLGEGHLLADIENAIYGMSVDETKTTEISFPEEHQNAELKGKTAKIEIIVESIKQFNPHPIDDDLAKQSNTGETIDELKAKFKESYTKRQTDVLKNLFEQKCIQKVVDNVNLNIPTTLLQNEMRGILKHRQEMLRGFHFPEAQIQKLLAETDVEQLKTEAKNRISMAFIFDRLLEKGTYSLDQVSDEEIKQEEKKDESPTLLKKGILYKRFVESIVANAK